MEMKLELVPLPVSDVDRAKAFYVEQVGFTLDHDVRPDDTMRVVQLTPPPARRVQLSLARVCTTRRLDRCRACIWSSRTYAQHAMRSPDRA